MSGSPRLLHRGVQALALGAVAWASLELALLVAQTRFSARLGTPPDGSLARGMALGLVVGAGVWLYGRSDRLAAGVWRAVSRRRGA